jgi:hypothetical protein
VCHLLSQGLPLLLAINRRLITKGREAKLQIDTFH